MSRIAVVIAAFVSGVFLSGCESDSGGGRSPVDTQATTSGGLATINTGDSVVGFVPIGNSIAVVPLEGTLLDATPQALNVAAPIQHFLMDAMPVQISFDVDSCGADNVALKVVCVGYNSSMVAILDVAGLISAGAEPNLIEIDAGVDTSRRFSGGSCINCGVLSDAGRGQFIVSSSDGYRVYDYSGTLRASYLSDAEAVPPRDLSTENFSFDQTRRLIISPEYDSRSEQHVYLIHIDSGIIYRWVNRMVAASRDAELGLASLDEINQSNLEADSAAVDPTTGVVTMGDESGNALLVLNLAAAVFDNSSATFDAPDSAFRLEQVATNNLTTGQAIEPVSHLLFLEDEFGSSMGVAQLPIGPSSGPIALGDYTSANIPDTGDACPAAGRWTNVGDPHGLAIFTSNTSGNNPKGLLVNSTKTCAAVVDLSLLLKAPKEEATDSNIVASDTDLVSSGIVRFVNIPQP